MNKVFTSILKVIIPRKLRSSIREALTNELNGPYQPNPCYGQEGEDLILNEFLNGIKKGFFVDIGSYHPILYSNTYLFYLKGWRGINIDARPDSMIVFNQIRPEDINLEVAIGKEEKELTYFMFDEPGLNGFSSEHSHDRDTNTSFKIQNKVNIKLRRLEHVLDEYLPEGTNISFMSIDVEGLDFEVLESNNWVKYKPSIILVETSITADGLALNSPIHLFLSEKGYELVAKTYRTSFYKLNK